MSNWANLGKQALAAVENDGLQAVGGGGGEIATFYRMTPPKDGNDPKARQLKKGDVVTGTYSGSFVTKKYATTFYKIQTDAGIVAVPGSGQLNLLMDAVAEGATVKIVYNGRETISKGKFAGKEAHAFSVRASVLKP